MIITKESLKELYINQGLSLRECAKKLGLPSHGGIAWRLKKFGIKARPARFQKGNTFNKIRKGAESPFYKGGKIDQKCRKCGKLFKIYPSQKSVFTRCDKCKKERFDLTDSKFGLLEVIERYGYAKGGHILWRCRCECGKTTTVRSADLKSGKTRSCGCEQGQKGDKSPKWIGGQLVAGFDSYANKIKFAEKTRRSPSNNKILEVTCTYCGKWFTPTTSQVSQRVRALFGQKGGVGECRFYCSDNCKKACPTFRKIRWPEGSKPATSREVQPELRQMRLLIDDYTCQKEDCKKTIDEAELHCHHNKSVELNPIESADVDNCITLCKKCHVMVHKECDGYFKCD